MEKVALVAAGGSGIGATTARRFAADGCKVGVLSSFWKGRGGLQGQVGLTGSNQSKDNLARLVDGTISLWETDRRVHQ